MKKIITIIAILTITIIACKKETDSESPVITILKPTAGVEYRKDSVIISFSVADVDLHEVGFTINRITDDSVFYNFPKDHVHDNPFLFLDTLSINTTTHADYVLKIVAEDHNGNESTKTSDHFHIHND